MFSCFSASSCVLLPKRNIAEYADEEETLRATLEANPNDAVAHNNLGYLMETVYKVTGRLRHAVLTVVVGLSSSLGETRNKQSKEKYGWLFFFGVVVECREGESLRGKRFSLSGRGLLAFPTTNDTINSSSRARRHTMRWRAITTGGHEQADPRGGGEW